MIHDVVIVGGGVAGLSAALVLARARRRVLIVDDQRPRNRFAGHVHGFLTRDGAAPNDLLELARREVAAYGVQFINDTVLRTEHGFRVVTSDGRAFQARRMLVATGLRDVLPELEGLSECWGRDVHSCPHCHGWEVADKPLAVLGTHPPSPHQALLVRQWSSDVIFFPDLLSDFAADVLTGNDVRVVAGRVSRLVVRSGRLYGVELESGVIVQRAAAFVVTDLEPYDGLLTDLGCSRGPRGLIDVDSTGYCGLPGVWAAGNVIDGGADLMGAAGQGTRAAVAINRDLLDEDTRTG
jgi:thioredoxin reductase